ncbi:hypothetical protein [Nonomuraea recticatena]|uniref:hypothetical protein n=1 Tax=Nonomuraea recticatena TaxID=46178 RepID=UPI0036070545
MGGLPVALARSWPLWPDRLSSAGRGRTGWSGGRLGTGSTARSVPLGKEVAGASASFGVPVSIVSSSLPVSGLRSLSGSLLLVEAGVSCAGGRGAGCRGSFIRVGCGASLLLGAGSGRSDFFGSCGRSDGVDRSAGLPGLSRGGEVVVPLPSRGMDAHASPVAWTASQSTVAARHTGGPAAPPDRVLPPSAPVRERAVRPPEADAADCPSSW